jgi:hypothetical protein
VSRGAALARGNAELDIIQLARAQAMNGERAEGAGGLVGNHSHAAGLHNVRGQWWSIHQGWSVEQRGSGKDPL